MVSISTRAFVAAAALTALAFVADGGTPGPQPTPPSVPCPVSSTQMNDAMALLNRIGDVVDQTMQRSPAVQSARQPQIGTDQSGSTGTTSNDRPGQIKVSGGTANTVAIARDKLAEIRAEVEQIKTILASK